MNTITVPTSLRAVVLRSKQTISFTDADRKCLSEYTALHEQAFRVACACTALAGILTIYEQQLSDFFGELDAFHEGLHPYRFLARGVKGKELGVREFLGIHTSLDVDDVNKAFERFSLLLTQAETVLAGPARLFEAFVPASKELLEEFDRFAAAWIDQEPSVSMAFDRGTLLRDMQVFQEWLGTHTVKMTEVCEQYFDQAKREAQLRADFSELATLFQHLLENLLVLEVTPLPDEKATMLN